MNLLTWLTGRKTYFICAAALLVQAGLMFGVVTEGTYAMLMGFLAPAGIIALRAGIAKAPPPPAPTP